MFTVDDNSRNDNGCCASIRIDQSLHYGHILLLTVMELDQ